VSADTAALLIVVSQEDTASNLLSVLRDQGLQPQSSGRRNLDGAAVSSWLVVASIAVKMAPDILRALADLLRHNQVDSIEYDGFKIVHPRPEDVDEILKRLPPPPPPTG
jgi:hypothetical protein